MFRRISTQSIFLSGASFASRRCCAADAGAKAATAEAPTTATKGQYDALEKQLKEAEETIKKLTTESLYKAAACENLRKEMIEAKKKAEAQSKESFAKDMLEVCDALHVVSGKVDEYLKQNAEVPSSHASILAGVKLTEDVAIKTLKRFGVTKAPPRVGEPFDEKVEEKLFTVPSTPEVKDGCVAEIIKDGYLLDGSILRKAQVAISEDP